MKSNILGVSVSFEFYIVKKTQYFSLPVFWEKPILNLNLFCFALQ